MEAQDERSVHSHITPSPGALTGLRVIELADEQAEYCGLALAGLGAEVIKVEPPGGSPTRRIGPFYEDREDPERSCSSGSTTAASARSCSICASRQTATSSVPSSPPPTCCWSPRPGENWTAWDWGRTRSCSSFPRSLWRACPLSVTMVPGPTSRAQTWYTWRWGAS